MFFLRMRFRSAPLLIASALGLGPLPAWTSQGAMVKGIDFKNVSGASVLQIRSDGPVSFEKTENASDQQIVLELKGAKLSRNSLRKIDTSSFDSPVKLVSPYQLEGQDPIARIVVQLRKAAPSEATQEGNLITLRIENPGGVASVIDPVPTQQTAAAPDPADGAAPAPAVEALKPVEPSRPDPADANPDQLTAALNAGKTGQFSGRPITLQVRDADVNDVLRLISDASGFNIVVGDDVKGKLTLSLVDVPWDQALDVVLHTLKLGAERNNNLLRVVTLASLTQEKQQELAAKNAAAANAPKVTKVFSISYADGTSLIATIKSLAADGTASGVGSTGGSGGGSTDGPRIEFDKRTNSLIVQDRSENIEKIKKLIEILDTQTPQILIEAKVVEATEGFQKSLGGSIGLGNGASSTQFFASFASSNPVDSLIGTPGVFADGAGIAAGGGNQFGFSPSLSFIPGVSRLNALLSLNEADNSVKVVSSPKLVVLNKETANVVQSTPVGIPSQTVSNGVITNTIQIQQANLGLKVTPTITNDGSVQLDLDLQRQIPFSITGGTAVADRSLKTKVLVDSGSTLVIGGVYTMQNTHKSSGFPILRKIPILGVLFGTESDDVSRSELFFFITPKILNTRESGLGEPATS